MESKTKKPQAKLKELIKEAKKIAERGGNAKEFNDQILGSDKYKIYVYLYDDLGRELAHYRRVLANAWNDFREYQRRYKVKEERVGDNRVIYKRGYTRARMKIAQLEIGNFQPRVELLEAIMATGAKTIAEFYDWAVRTVGVKQSN